VESALVVSSNQGGERLPMMKTVGHTRDIKTGGHLGRPETLRFQELEQQYELTESQRYRYLQVKYALTRYGERLQDVAEETTET
ncbi:hypothetical protein NDU88_003107, partial [Pleurodeles waltl]